MIFNARIEKKKINDNLFNEIVMTFNRLPKQTACMIAENASKARLRPVGRSSPLHRKTARLEMRVGLSDLSAKDRAIAAVIAWIRHTHTNYNELIEKHSKYAARERVKNNVTAWYRWYSGVSNEKPRGKQDCRLSTTM